MQPALIALVVASFLAGPPHDASTPILIMELPSGGWASITPDPLPGSITVTHGAGSDIIQSLTSQEILALSGGTLQVSGSVQGTGSITMAGGTLVGGNVQQLITGTSSGGTLSGDD
jgi:hypothetical protein